VERKLENAGKDVDERVDKLQRKLDEANMNLKKKEKEFDDTMDGLQGDIDVLEHEKSDLKERLKVLSKKTLLEGLGRQSGAQSGVSGGSGSLGVGPMTVKDSPMLLQQIDSLREALRAVKDENIRMASERMKSQMARLPPLRVPKKPTGMASQTGLVKIGDVDDKENTTGDLKSITRNANHLLTDLYKLCSSPTVVDITKRKPGVEPVTETASPMNQLVESTANLARLQRNATDLQVQVTSLLAANRTGGQVRTDFSTFTTPAFAKVLHEKQIDTQCIGTISIPTVKGKGDRIPVNVTPDQLRRIHARFL
jgi:dynactin 1